MSLPFNPEKMREAIDAILPERNRRVGAHVVEITECRDLLDGGVVYRIVIDESSPTDYELQERVLDFLRDEFFAGRKAPRIEVSTEW